MASALLDKHGILANIPSAEDNPSNDYPEDEVSSDDEYGYNPYHKYRDHPSDHEYEDIATNSW